MEHAFCFFAGCSGLSHPQPFCDVYRLAYHCVRHNSLKKPPFSRRLCSYFDDEKQQKSEKRTGGKRSNRVPALFSPLMSVLFTLLFTPMFGAFLQGLNWRELGNDELAARNMGWVKWTFITFAVYTFSEPFIRDTFFGRYLMIALFIGFWVSWTFSLGIKQIKYVKNFVPFTRKSSWAVRS